MTRCSLGGRGVVEEKWRMGGECGLTLSLSLCLFSCRFFLPSCVQGDEEGETAGRGIVKHPFPSPVLFPHKSSPWPPHFAALWMPWFPDPHLYRGCQIIFGQKKVFYLLHCCNSFVMRCCGKGRLAWPQPVAREWEVPESLLAPLPWHKDLCFSSVCVWGRMLCLWEEN